MTKSTEKTLTKVGLVCLSIMFVLSFKPLCSNFIWIEDAILIHTGIVYDLLITLGLGFGAFACLIHLTTF